MSVTDKFIPLNFDVSTGLDRTLYFLDDVLLVGIITPLIHYGFPQRTWGVGGPNRVCHSPLFVSNIFRKYLIWLPGPQGLQKHKSLCCQTCIKVPTEPMSVSHYSDITAIRGQLLCHSSNPYCTRYRACGTVFMAFLLHPQPGNWGSSHDSIILLPSSKIYMFFNILEMYYMWLSKDASRYEKSEKSSAKMKLQI